MNKTLIGCTLGLGATVVASTATILVAIWMAWGNTSNRIDRLSDRVTGLEIRLAVIENRLIGGENSSGAAASQ
ncbi:MAG: hypothetical protein OXF66_05410 [Gammaproteobacteria bacterium]|nr:hypothetical protein [Gammaproteobacteria bacterium]MCY4165259.1 hypothetical protein [Gammaproteobacteria bacterium]MCY4256253.1 hypothetical protein [Gammaproteobacteria bacterium]MCY4341247.1 hypothetical protein [Gammaproteobacteria bacterium]